METVNKLASKEPIFKSESTELLDTIVGKSIRKRMEEICNEVQQKSYDNECFTEESTAQQEERLLEDKLTKWFRTPLEVRTK